MLTEVATLAEADSGIHQIVGVHLSWCGALPAMETLHDHDDELVGHECTGALQHQAALLIVVCSDRLAQVTNQDPATSNCWVLSSGVCLYN